MSIIKRKHLMHIKFIIIFLFLLANCQLQEPKKLHGINYLENRKDILIINKSNKNDVVKLLGNPHSKSIANENKWFYFERMITRGKLHKLGRNVLKKNNVLEIEFNKYGVLTSKKIYTKNDMKKVKLSTKKTENTVTKKSFLNSFLSSIKQKMYGQQRKKRK
jgi:outer membrane protein assembly factor BamE (lipoprotein component of BamABCDE complex)